MERIQVLVTPEEKAAFRRRAKEEGESLSGWLKRVGLERLRAGERDRRFASADDARRFFAEHAEEGDEEPSWEEHLAVMKASRGRGAGDS